jgi:hypothetical protein
MPPPAKDQIFISYRHEDTKWREDLEKHLKPYLRAGSIKSWSDKQISPGSEWLTEIKTALTNTKVAVLLVTPDFIASDFIHKIELGPLLEDAKQGGFRILWVPVRASSYKRTVLKDYQAVLDPAQPLANMTDAERDWAWVTICEKIEKAVSEVETAEAISNVELKLGEQRSILEALESTIKTLKIVVRGMSFKRPGRFLTREPRYGNDSRLIVSSSNSLPTVSAALGFSSLMYATIFLRSSCAASRIITTYMPIASGRYA